MTDQWVPGFILGLSILLQLLAALLALRLIPVSRGRVAWIFLSAALVLMAMRRFLPFYRLVTGQGGRPPDVSAELIALAISVLLVAAMCAIRPLFEERERAAEALRHARKAWEDIFQAIGQPALVLDAEHRILAANRAAYQTFDLPADAIGRRCHEFVHGTSGSPTGCPAEGALGSGSASVVELELESTGGVFLVSCTPIHDEGGGPAKIIHIATDITERKRLEERLRQSEKLEAIGQLAGGIAHDFNNQLSSVMGYAEMLERRLEDPRLRGYAQSIVRAVNRAADLTRELLAFARKGKYLSAPVNIHELIGEVVMLLSRSIDKRVNIRQTLYAPSPTITGDPTQLQSALLNLAINARDAMPQGGILGFSTDVVALGAEPGLLGASEIAPGEYLRVRVTDTGVGMDPATLRHIFEPFFTTKERDKGTGMGLASVYGTVQAHGGAVSAASEPGRGTTISLHLPLAAPEAETAGPAASAQPVPGVGRILIVDDEREVREMLAATLGELGYEVAVCADGVEAVEYCRGEGDRIDLVILDMVMPRMAGPATFAALRALVPGLRVLLCSGHSVEGEAQAIIDEGAVGFLQKPFRAAELSRKVAEIFGTNGLSGAGEGPESRPGRDVG